MASGQTPKPHLNIQIEGKIIQLMTQYINCSSISLLYTLRQQPIPYIAIFQMQPSLVCPISLIKSSPTSPYQKMNANQIIKTQIIGNSDNAKSATERQQIRSNQLAIPSGKSIKICKKRKKVILTMKKETLPQIQQKCKEPANSRNYKQSSSEKASSLLSKPFESLGKNQMSDFIKYKLKETLIHIERELNENGMSLEMLDKPIFATPKINDHYIEGIVKDEMRGIENITQKYCTEHDEQIENNSSLDNFQWMAKYNISKMVLSQALRSLEYGSPSNKLSSKKFCPDCVWPQINLNDYLHKDYKAKHIKKAHGKYLCDLCEESLNNRAIRCYHKKTLCCIKFLRPENKFGSLAESLELNEPKQNASQRQAMQSCCQILIDSGNIQNSCIMAHRLLQHGDFDKLQYTLKLIADQGEFKKLSKKQTQSLINNGILIVDANEGLVVKDQRFMHDTKVLCLFYDEELRAAVEFKYVQQSMRRLCILKSYMHAGKFCLDLAVCIYELKAQAERQRITEVHLVCEQQSAWYFSRLQFFKHENQSIYSELREAQSKLQEPVFLSLKTAESLRSLMQTIKINRNLPASLKGNAQRIILKHLKQINLQQMLERYLQVQLNFGGSEKNQVAKIQDQAITPDEVFEKIRDRIKISKQKMFDVCPYKQQWNSKLDYNALIESWDADINYLNPPYSIATIFNTKQFIEFLKGRNIVTLIPQISIENTFSPILYRLVGEILNLGQIAFVDFINNLPTPVTLIILLQPEFLDNLLVNKLSQVSNWDPRDRQEGSVLQNQVSIKEEKKNLALRYLCCGAGVRDIHLMLKLSPALVSEYSRLELSSFKSKFFIEP